VINFLDSVEIVFLRDHVFETTRVFYGITRMDFGSEYGGEGSETPWGQVMEIRNVRKKYLEDRDHGRRAGHREAEVKCFFNEYLGRETVLGSADALPFEAPRRGIRAASSETCTPHGRRHRVRDDKPPHEEVD